MTSSWQTRYRVSAVPYRGRTVWVLLAGEPSSESSRAMRALSEELISLAAVQWKPADGRLVLKLQL